MAKNSTTQPKRGRGRPSLVPGMVAEIRAGHGEVVEIGGLTGVQAMTRAANLAKQNNVKVVECVIRAKAVRKPRAAKGATATA